MASSFLNQSFGPVWLVQLGLALLPKLLGMSRSVRWQGYAFHIAAGEEAAALRRLMLEPDRRLLFLPRASHPQVATSLVDPPGKGWRKAAGLRHAGSTSRALWSIWQTSKLRTN